VQQSSLHDKSRIYSKYHPVTKACAKENEQTMWLMWRSVLLQLTYFYKIIVLLL